MKTNYLKKNLFCLVVLASFGMANIVYADPITLPKSKKSQAIVYGTAGGAAAVTTGAATTKAINTRLTKNATRAAQRAAQIEEAENKTPEFLEYNDNETSQFYDGTTDTMPETAPKKSTITLYAGEPEEEKTTVDSTDGKAPPSGESWGEDSNVTFGKSSPDSLGADSSATVAKKSILKNKGAKSYSIDKNKKLKKRINEDNRTVDQMESARTEETSQTDAYVRGSKYAEEAQSTAEEPVENTLTPKSAMSRLTAAKKQYLEQAKNNDLDTASTEKAIKEKIDAEFAPRNKPSGMSGKEWQAREYDALAKAYNEAHESDKSNLGEQSQAEEEPQAMEETSKVPTKNANNTLDQTTDALDQAEPPKKGFRNFFKKTPKKRVRFSDESEIRGPSQISEEEATLKAKIAAQKKNISSTEADTDPSTNPASETSNAPEITAKSSSTSNSKQEKALEKQMSKTEQGIETDETTESELNESNSSFQKISAKDQRSLQQTDNTLSAEDKMREAANPANKSEADAMKSEAEADIEGGAE